MGRQQGRQEAMVEAMDQGRRDGELAAARDAIFEVLEIRFEWVPERVRNTVNGIRNAARLRALLRKAITVSSMAEFEREMGLRDGPTR